MTRVPPARRRTVLGKVTTSIAVLAAVAAVEVFAATGAFDTHHDPFPVSVTADLGRG